MFVLHFRETTAHSCTSLIKKTSWRGSLCLCYSSNLRSSPGVGCRPGLLSGHSWSASVSMCHVAIACGVCQCFLRNHWGFLLPHTALRAAELVSLLSLCVISYFCNEIQKRKRGRRLTGLDELWSLPSHQRCKTVLALFTAAVSKIHK